MKALEKDSLKVKKKAIAKPFPGKLVLGQSMIDKYEHAKSMSASITGFKEKK